MTVIAVVAPSIAPAEVARQPGQRFTEGFLSSEGSTPQLVVTKGVIRKYFPGPNMPLWSMTSALPLTLIPLGLQGSTDTRSSTTSETLPLPVVRFLYLLVPKNMLWLWLPIQKYFPSNSNPTGETSGVPFVDALATLANLWVFR